VPEVVAGGVQLKLHVDDVKVIAFMSVMEALAKFAIAALFALVAVKVPAWLDRLLAKREVRIYPNAVLVLVGSVTLTVTGIGGPPGVYVVMPEGKVTTTLPPAVAVPL
jgi:hypothetical protein